MTTTANSKLRMIAWLAMRAASRRWPDPKAWPINAVAPVENPIPMAIRRKKIGNDSDRAARASVEYRPAQKVSTTL